MDADEGALEVAEGVCADAFDVEAIADTLGEEITECTAAGELDVSVGVPFFLAEEFDDHGGAVGIGYALGDGDCAAAVFCEYAIHVFEELFGFEVTLGDVDEVGPVVEVFLGKGGGCGEEAGVAAHDAAYVNAFEGAVIEVGTHECLGDETCGRAKAGAVVVFHEVVVDGFWDMDGAQIVALGPGLFINDADGI